MEKNEIVATSFALFKQYGLKNVSMDRIASELGVSKKTLYVHFENKEELVQQGVQKVMDDFIAEFNCALTLNQHPLIKLSLILRSILVEVAKYNQAYFHTIRRYSSDVWQGIEALRNKFIADYFNPLLREADTQGCLQKGLNIDLFAEVNLSRVDERYQQMIETHYSLSLPECYRHLIIYPINGICQPECSLHYLTEMEKITKRY